MPFGLKNAPATFQRMMDTALRGLINNHCFVYLDDIIIFGQSIEEHNKNLAIVFQGLREVGLYKGGRSIQEIRTNTTG